MALRDCSRVLDVELSNVARTNMTLVASMFEYPPKASGEHIKSLFKLNNKIRVRFTPEFKQT